MFIGETHARLAPILFVQHNLQHFKGLKQVFLETLPVSMQPTIDAFMRGDQKAETHLKVHLHAYGHIGEATMDVLRIAREKKIDVYALEEWQGATAGSEVRLSESNPAWAETVRRHTAGLKPGETFLVYGGFSHSHSGQNDKVPGVDALLGIPSYDIFDQSTIAHVKPDQRNGFEEHWPHAQQFRPSLLARDGFQLIKPENGASSNLVVLPDTYGQLRGTPYYEASTSGVYWAPQDSSGHTISRDENFFYSMARFSILGLDARDLSRQPDISQALNIGRSNPDVDKALRAKLTPQGYDALIAVQAVLQRKGDATRPDDPSHAELVARMGDFRAHAPEDVRENIPDVSTMHKR